MSKQTSIEKLEEFIEQADKMKKQDKMDLSSDQDLSIAIMNLVSIEEHFVFSGARTGNNQYYDLVKDVRSMRRELLGKIVKNPDGEVWCISKHLLAACMRLMEVGTKQLSMNNKAEAYNFFQKAYDLYSLFWGLNLDLIDTSNIKQIDETAINKHDKEKSSLFGKLGQLVKKAIDCCLE